MLPNVIETLKGAGIIHEFVQFNRLLSEGKLPLTNIAFLLSLDIVGLYSLDDATTAMPYCEEAKEFQIVPWAFLTLYGWPKEQRTNTAQRNVYWITET